jgi:hypothetical protein
MTFARTPLAVALGLLALSSQTLAATSYFSSFTPLAASAGPTANEALPFTLSSPNFSQVILADRATQNTVSPGSNSGNWDMITANETGAQAGRYLFMPYETATGGVQRVDLWDNNYNTRTVTIVSPGTQGFVAGDASLWTPWGSYLTGEECWGGACSTKGRLFEVTDATTAAAGSANFVQRNVLPRVSHEGLAFDAAKSLYFIDELNGGSVYKYVSANPNATTGDQYFNAGQTFALKVGAGGQFEGNNGPAITGAATWVAITTATGTPTIDTFGAFKNLGGGSFAMDGRLAADLVSATGYNRPEDMEIQNVNGNQRLYFATPAVSTSWTWPATRSSSLPTPRPSTWPPARPWAAVCAVPTIWPSMPTATSTSSKTAMVVLTTTSGLPRTSTRTAICSTTVKAWAAGPATAPWVLRTRACTLTSSTPTRPT